MKIYSNKAFAFKNPNVNDNILTMNDANEAEIKIVPGFNTVPDFVTEDDMFKWAKADGDIQVFGASDDESVQKNNYTGKKAKELYDMCIEKSLVVEERKDRQYYVDKLNEAE